MAHWRIPHAASTWQPRGRYQPSGSLCQHNPQHPTAIQLPCNHTLAHVAALWPAGRLQAPAHVATRGPGVSLCSIHRLPPAHRLPKRPSLRCPTCPDLAMHSHNALTSSAHRPPCPAQPPTRTTTFHEKAIHPAPLGSLHAHPAHGYPLPLLHAHCDPPRLQLSFIQPTMTCPLPSSRTPPSLPHTTPAPLHVQLDELVTDGGGREHPQVRHQQADALRRRVVPGRVDHLHRDSDVHGASAHSVWYGYADLTHFRSAVKPLPITSWSAATPAAAGPHHRHRRPASPT